MRDSFYYRTLDSTHSHIGARHVGSDTPRERVYAFIANIVALSRSIVLRGARKSAAPSRCRRAFHTFLSLYGLHFFLVTETTRGYESWGILVAYRKLIKFSVKRGHTFVVVRGTFCIRTYTFILRPFRHSTRKMYLQILCNIYVRKCTRDPPSLARILHIFFSKSAISCDDRSSSIMLDLR